MIGGSAGIGLETARRARTEGADVILTGRNPDRLHHAARGTRRAEHRRLRRHRPGGPRTVFHDLPEPVDHVMVTAGGPYYARLADMDFAQVGRGLAGRLR